MRILYLVKHSTFINKMSRVRFHGIEEIAKITKLKYWGIGWPNYDENLSVQQNIDNLKEDFDLVICYKPLELINFNEVKLPKCIRYNEMYNFSETLNEIEHSNADLVICHHQNDMKTYQAYYSNYHGQINKNISFYHIPHCAKASVFKNYNLEKNIDVLICGRLKCKNSLGDQHYPLRERFLSLLPKLSNKYNCKIHKHPGYNHLDSHTDKYLIQFAKEINSAKICLSCSGLPKSRFGKYVEIPLCHSLLLADIPDQDKNIFRQVIVEISMEMTDEEIIKKIEYYLENKEERELQTKKGFLWASKYTQDYYAKTFVKYAQEFLVKYHTQDVKNKLKKQTIYKDEKRDIILNV